MEKEISIVCFYWKGVRWQGNDRGPDYVNALHNGVRANLGRPFRFICFTNEGAAFTENLRREVEVRNFYMPANSGVLPRLFMFSTESRLTGQVLALDIDVVITGNLDDIASYTGNLAVRSKFAPGQEWKADGDIIGFRASPMNEALFWLPFKHDPQRVVDLTGGRERYWFRHVIKEHFEGGDCDRWDLLCPNQIASYKRHIRPRKGDLPRNTRIVSCHGRPRPHEINEPWVKKYWNP